MYPREQYPYAVLYFTGPAMFNKWLREKAYKKGLSIMDYTMVPIGKDEEDIRVESEEQIFEKLGIEWVPPEKRGLQMGME